MTSRLEKGDKAPVIQLPSTSGEMIDLSTPAKNGLVVFFYPKDSTPGCTTEAQTFSSLEAEFSAKGVDIIGVSKDSIASHEKFRTKSELSVHLASDEDGKACEAFGVSVEKNMYGRKYFGIERSTFLIDKSGTIVEAWRKVKVKGHPEAVLEATQALA